MSATPLKIETTGLTLGFGARIVQQDVALRVRAGSIFALMGGSGCGKSTVLKSLFGLLRSFSGEVLVDGVPNWDASDDHRIAVNRRYGVLFQSAALWSSLTVAENVALPLRLFTRAKPATIADLVRLKLALVGMDSAAHLMPAEFSGGMRKRAGLDPITSRRLDADNRTVIATGSPTALRDHCAHPTV